MNQSGDNFVMDQKRKNRVRGVVWTLRKMQQSQLTSTAAKRELESVGWAVQSHIGGIGRRSEAID